MSTHGKMAVGLAAAVALGASPVHAQATADTTLATVVAQVRNPDPNRDPTLAASRILSQTTGPQPRARLDALADSLVAIATADGPLAETQRQASAARGILRYSGSGLAPVPYPGAFDALVRIYHGNERLRAGTLSAMTRLVDRGPVLPFFIEVATSDDTTAYRALTLLLERFGPEGEAAVRQLYREGRVTQPLAVRVLNQIAYHRGWDEPSTR